MAQLHELPKVVTKSKKVVGRGHGSGRGKTAGRGTKGQKARGTIPHYFEGGALRLIKRLPLLRGKGRNKVFLAKPVTIQVGALNSLKKDSVVDFAALIKQGLIAEEEAKRRGVKILGDGNLEIPLVVKVPVTAGAKAKIEKAGGQVEE